MKLLKCFASLIVLAGLTFSQTTYYWTGTANSNFSAAGNWTPLRPIGLNTDILVFETGTELNVMNVQQVTIGELIIRRNTSLTLSPSAGNTKCITIKGGTGEDLVIESGSSLRILGNDPALNIYLSTGATADISGYFTFQGEIAHNINTADPLSLKFNSGSVFTQSCPGNIFNSTGTMNSAIFKNGSTFNINHTNALSPFGLLAPSTKVIFEPQSNLVILETSSILLNGRSIPNLTIEQYAVLNAVESFTDGLTVGNLTIKNSGSLIVGSTDSYSIPEFNIQGNISVNGTFRFSTNSGSKFRISLNGTETQSISGSGEIIIPEKVELFSIDNDLILFRDLIVSCPIIHNSGSVVLNGHYIKLPSTKNQTVITRPVEESAGSNLKENSNSPEEISISQNYPNPFNPSTKIDFEVPVDSKVSLKVYDISGKEISTLVNDQVMSGYHTVDFISTGLSSGVYFYQLNAFAGNQTFTKVMKMILTK
ncbi:MAG: T9SS type A sorting domain-containing protein [Ignavibacteria bacterium]|nr:T9SS type A sorting domain-containing protein [Ignavibacteria bacterium]